MQGGCRPVDVGGGVPDAPETGSGGRRRASDARPYKKHTNMKSPSRVNPGRALCVQEPLGPRELTLAGGAAV